MTDHPDPAGGSELNELFVRYRATRDPELREQLVEINRPIAVACARQFAARGEPIEDLVQVAFLAMIKAIDRFDPAMGIPFAGFAVPTIRGEVRRHFRDTTWSLYVPRRAKDLHVRLTRAREQLRASLSRPPTPAELAAELGCSVEDVLDALEVAAAYSTESTDTPDGSRIRDATEAGGMTNEDRVLLEQLLLSLPERERKIVWLRFFEDLSQVEIAQIVGSSQVHVSRLLRDALRTLRAAALEAGESESAAAEPPAEPGNVSDHAPDAS